MSDILQRFNRAITSGAFRAPLLVFSRRSRSFDSTTFVSELSRHANFLDVTVRGMVDAATKARAHFSAVSLSLAELDGIELPILLYLKDEKLQGTMLLCLTALQNNYAVFEVGHATYVKIYISDVERRWTGICLIPKERQCLSEELESYINDISVIPALVSRDECSELVDLCEDSMFRRSKVLNRDGDGDGVISTKVRSSSSVTLTNRGHPLLRRIYRACADLEGINERSIETIQAVRYKRSQRFAAHYDGSVKLPRRRTYLLYLNDGFEGGETFFPLISKSVSPVAGSCLRFSSCAPDGRVLWPSEHGGLAVASGVKYALNIWVRCSS